MTRISITRLSYSLLPHKNKKKMSAKRGSWIPGRHLILRQLVVYIRLGNPHKIDALKARDAKPIGETNVAPAAYVAKTVKLKATKTRELGYNDISVYISRAFGTHKEGAYRRTYWAGGFGFLPITKFHCILS